MIIQVKVVPNAKKNEVSTTAQGLHVRLAAPASDNRANKALIELLSEYYGVNKSKIRLVKGLKARDKTIEIEK